MQPALKRELEEDFEHENAQKQLGEQKEQAVV